MGIQIFCLLKGKMFSPPKNLKSSIANSMRSFEMYSLGYFRFRSSLSLCVSCGQYIYIYMFPINTTITRSSKAVPSLCLTYRHAHTHSLTRTQTYTHTHTSPTASLICWVYTCLSHLCIHFPSISVHPKNRWRNKGNLLAFSALSLRLVNFLAT